MGDGQRTLNRRLLLTALVRSLEEVAERTVSGFPPFAASISSMTLSLSSLPLTTFVLSLNFRPCFVSMRWNCLAISASMPAPIAGRNSTTVTSEPSLLQTDPEPINQCNRKKGVYEFEANNSRADDNEFPGYFFEFQSPGT